MKVELRELGVMDQWLRALFWKAKEVVFPVPTKQFRDRTPSAGRYEHCRQVVLYMQAKHRQKVEPRKLAKEEVKMSINDNGEWLTMHMALPSAWTCTMQH